jgi:signal transduction histidine kinase
MRMRSSRRLGWWFALAVIVPGVLLAGLAVRAIRREQVYLEKRLADALTAEVLVLVSGVNEELERIRAELSASAPVTPGTSLESWRKGSPLVGMPFLLSPSFELLQPRSEASPSAEARVFLRDNAAFLTNRAESPVYENVALAFREQAPAVEAKKAEDSPAEPAPADTASAESALTGSAPAAEGAPARAEATAPEPPSRRPVETVQQALSDFESRKEVRAKVYAQAEEQGRKPLARTVSPRTAPEEEKQATGSSPSLFVAEPRLFAQITADQAEGLLPRFTGQDLELLFWKRLPGGRIIGCRLDTQVLRRRLLATLPQVYTRERVLILLDERGQPLFAPQERDPRDYSRPFVAREVGELLPRWEAAAYLTDPQALPTRARLIASVLWALIGLLVVSILSGGTLVLRALRGELELARQKTSFLAGVSHELKTPLTSIRMYAEMLQEGRQPDPQRRQQYLQIMVDEAQRLTRLVNNVLDYAQLEQGKRRYELSPQDPVELCRSLLEAERPRLEKAGFIVSFDPGGLASAPGLKLLADPEAIRQALLNLLSNAEKYSGEVKDIRLELERRSGRILVRVLDRGRGIPGAQARHLFQEFYRAEEALTSRIQGTGLGLAIARRIARDHGGDIRFLPRPGGGSVFQVELPIGGAHG